ncbi:hypothetical protein Tco_0053975 [Tanacetum coccineum]
MWLLDSHGVFVFLVVNTTVGAWVSGQQGSLGLAVETAGLGASGWLFHSQGCVWFTRLHHKRGVWLSYPQQGLRLAGFHQHRVDKQGLSGLAVETAGGAVDSNTHRVHGFVVSTDQSHMGRLAVSSD